MLERGIAQKLVVYVGASEKFQGEPVYQKIVSFLRNHGCAGATVTRSFVGFGASGKMRDARGFKLTEDASMRVEAVDARQKITALLPWIYEMVANGLIEVQETEVIKSAQRESGSEKEPPMKSEKLEGRAKMLRIHIGESDKWEGEPLHEAIVKKFRMMDIAGATVYRGVQGYGAQQRLYKKKGWFGLSTDDPIVIDVIDTEENIGRIRPVLDEMVDDGLIVISDVEIIKYTQSKTKSAERRT